MEYIFDSFTIVFYLFDIVPNSVYNANPSKGFEEK